MQGHLGEPENATEVRQDARLPGHPDSSGPVPRLGILGSPRRTASNSGSMQSHAGLAGAVDSSTGPTLTGNVFQDARCEEKIYNKKKDVYTNTLIQEAYDETGKVRVGVRWVDFSKDDDDTPNYRSRLVAKDIRRKGEDTIFAPTSPLEAIRACLSLAATPDI